RTGCHYPLARCGFGKALLQAALEGRGCSSHIGMLHQLHEGELRRAIDGHKEIELALGGAYLGQIDMEVSDRVALELFSTRPSAFNFWQPADAIPLQTTMQRRTSQPGDGGLERIEAIVQ